MPEPFGNAGADYIEQLLRAAMQVPAAPADPVGGRVVARLMVALGTKGEDERLEHYLSFSPGRRSVYEVTGYDDAGRRASRITDMPAGQAIRATTGLAAGRPDLTVALVARDGAGHERCVLTARGRVATYRFADTVAQVHEAPSAPESRAVAAEPAEAPGPEHPEWVAVTERLASLPTADELVDAVRSLVGEMAVDLHQRLGALPTTDEFANAVRELLGGVTIELDAAAIEDVVVAALDDLPQLIAAAMPGGAPVAGPDVPATRPGPVAADPGPVAEPGAAAADGAATARSRPGSRSSADGVAAGGGGVVGAGAGVAGHGAGVDTPPAGRVAVPPQVVTRRATDRHVDDAPQVMARPRRRPPGLLVPI